MCIETWTKPPQKSENSHEANINWQLRIWKYWVLLKGVSQVNTTEVLGGEGSGLFSLDWRSRDSTHRPEATPVVEAATDGTDSAIFQQQW